ncbi:MULTISPECIES: DUF4058 family protein [Nostocales]|uniref:DUF4058 family protein n=3 Tax=Nostocales TaxID=1161 RepID=A0A0C1QN17_9CYAN|nr:DUF4058 family protein [Tolypothrix bouteillei]KAF3889691.1 DUF4058 family protein [Tolypothrix bouteillei VB521301]
MPSPFPGMDPYLEQPTFWSSFHSRLIIAIADAIEPQLGSQYYVEVETRTYQSDDSEDGLLIGIPDAIIFSDRSDNSTEEQPIAGDRSTATQIRPERVEIPMPLTVNERYLEVREIVTDEVITVIELLSPKNKRSGDGRTAYEKKRRAILGSATHLVELDLLRGGKPMAILGMRSTTAYRILISRSDRRPAADLYSFSLQQQLPSFPIPLKPNEEEPLVPLQDIFNGVCDRARYSTRIDYSQPIPPPALSALD